MSSEHKRYNPDPHAHPGLHLLALFEAGKGVLALIGGASLGVIGPKSIRHFIGNLIRDFHLDPEHGPLPSLLNMVSPGAVGLAVGVLVLYAGLHLAEAWGLWRAKQWASWLGAIGTAAYLPLDLIALYHHPGWETWSVLAINLLIVGILARDLVKRRRRADISPNG